MVKKGFHRRSIRIPSADYRAAGGYFVTICAAKRRSVFGRIEGGEAILTPLGEIVQACWIDIPKHFPKATLKEFVVMPNHLHGIIALQGGHEVIQHSVGARPFDYAQGKHAVPSQERARIPEGFQRPVKHSIPTIVRSFKAAVTHEARKKLRLSSTGVWQRNYFERVLRNGQEYADASRYILENPVSWASDAENPARENEASGADLDAIVGARLGSARRPDSDAAVGARHGSARRPDSDAAVGARHGSARCPDSDAAVGARHGSARCPDSDAAVGARHGSARCPDSDAAVGARHAVPFDGSARFREGNRGKVKEAK